MLMADSNPIPNASAGARVGAFVATTGLPPRMHRVCVCVCVYVCVYFLSRDGPGNPFLYIHGAQLKRQGHRRRLVLPSLDHLLITFLLPALIHSPFSLPQEFSLLI